MKKRCTSGHVNGRRVFFMLLAAVGGGAEVKLERHAAKLEVYCGARARCGVALS